MSTAAAKEIWEHLMRGERAALARAITLVESTREEHRGTAAELVLRAARSEGAASAWRVGVTGPPGVGKSTFLDALGARLVGQGKRPAILAIDPSSQTSGGSLLGDQARMGRLVQSGSAFVRPSATRGHLGGAAAHTFETALLCAAAGYSPILVETVGVGQNEIEVSSLADVTVLLLQPGAGDELQGMKRGILEHADVVAVAQADGDRRELAERTRERFEQALRLVRGADAPEVRLVSSLEGQGIDELWSSVVSLLDERERSGSFDELRHLRQARAFRPRLLLELARAFFADDEQRLSVSAAEGALARGELTLPEAIERVLSGAVLGAPRRE